MAKTKITLNAEAEWLLGNPDASEALVLQHCSMVDNHGNRADDGDIKTYLFPVDRDYDVRWEGNAIENGQCAITQPLENWKYSVGIDFVVYLKKEPEKNIFDRLVLEGKGGKNSKVTAKVKNSGVIIGDKYTYVIVFSVYGDNWDKATFAIDPKMIVNT